MQAIGTALAPRRGKGHARAAEARESASVQRSTAQCRRQSGVASGAASIPSSRRRRNPSPQKKRQRENHSSVSHMPAFAAIASRQPPAKSGSHAAEGFFANSGSGRKNRRWRISRRASSSPKRASSASKRSVRLSARARSRRPRPHKFSIARRSRPERPHRKSRRLPRREPSARRRRAPCGRTCRAGREASWPCLRLRG